MIRSDIKHFEVPNTTLETHPMHILLEMGDYAVKLTKHVTLCRIFECWENFSTRSMLSNSISNFYQAVLFQLANLHYVLSVMCSNDLTPLSRYTLRELKQHRCDRRKRPLSPRDDRVTCWFVFADTQ